MKRTTMMRKCILLFFSIMLMGIMCCPQRVPGNASERNELSEKEAQAYANENNTWVICYEQGTRTSDFYQYDATKDYLYFSYSKHGCVDVYDTEGIFLYSIIFPGRQNGGISVRCENNQVYICTKDNILYIFSGAREIEHMDYDTAVEKGYDFFWFYDNEPHIKVDGRWTCWLDETGDVIKHISTPPVIKNTIPPPSGAMVAIPILGSSLLLAVFIMKALVQIVTSLRRKIEIP